MNIKDKIYEIKRNKVKEELTNHLGEVVENSDKLICYVKRSILKSKEFNETLLCYGINQSNIKLADAYNLNKPIWYIFDGIERHNQMLHIDGCYNSTILISNSNLANVFLDISTDGKLKINNSTLMGNLYFSLDAKDLEINRCIIKYMYNKDAIYNIYGENSINIKDSEVGNSKVNLDFGTPNLILSGNTIVGKTIDISEVRNLICDDNTMITAKENIWIEAESINQIDAMAPSITVNGKEYESRFVRNKYKEEIDQKRCELLDVLAKIRDKYTDKYSTMLKKHQDSLYSKPLARGLKK